MLRKLMTAGLVLPLSTQGRIAFLAWAEEQRKKHIRALKSPSPTNAKEASDGSPELLKPVLPPVLPHDVDLVPLLTAQPRVSGPSWICAALLSQRMPGSFPPPRRLTGKQAIRIVLSACLDKLHVETAEAEASVRAMELGLSATEARKYLFQRRGANSMARSGSSPFDGPGAGTSNAPQHGDAST